MASPSEGVTLAILAGGRGSRLGGVDKASLDLAGRPLLDYVIAAAGPLAQAALIIANDDRFADDPRFAVVRDPEPHAGVLPALLAALDAATTPLLLLVACDMPFIAPPLVEELVRLAGDADVVMPFVGGYDQPMLAAYRVATCRAAIRAALARGQRRMIAFLGDVRTRRVAEQDLRAVDPELRSFFNVNTPEDLDAARALVGTADRLPGRSGP